MTQMEAILLDERAAAATLGVSQRALQEWRRRGRGPQYARISSRCIRYRPEDLQKWALERLHTMDKSAAVVPA